MRFIGSATAKKNWHGNGKCQLSQNDQHARKYSLLKLIPTKSALADYLHYLFWQLIKLLNPIIYIPIGSNRHRFETNSCCSRCSQLLCTSQVSSCGNQSLGPLAAQSVHVVKLSAGFLTSISIWYFFLAIDHNIIWPKNEGRFLAANWGKKKSQIHLERWINWGIINSQPLFAQWDILQKKPLFLAFRADRQLKMPPGVSPETMDQDHTYEYAKECTGESYWKPLRAKVCLYKLDGEHPPKWH